MAPRIAYSVYSGVVAKPTVPVSPADGFIKVDYVYNVNRKIMWVRTSGDWVGVEILG